jgi:hypothetical protein
MFTAFPHVPLTCSAVSPLRQFDYKATKERNPIFGPLEEKDRKMAILQAITAVPADGKKVIIEAEEVEKVGAARLEREGSAWCTVPGGG